MHEEAKSVGFYEFCETFSEICPSAGSEINFLEAPVCSDVFNWPNWGSLRYLLEGHSVGVGTAYRRLILSSLLCSRHLYLVVIQYRYLSDNVSVIFEASANLNTLVPKSVHLYVYRRLSWKDVP